MTDTTAPTAADLAAELVRVRAELANVRVTLDGEIARADQAETDAEQAQAELQAELAAERSRVAQLTDQHARAQHLVEAIRERGLLLVPLRDVAAGFGRILADSDGADEFELLVAEAHTWTARHQSFRQQAGDLRQRLADALVEFNRQCATHGRVPEDSPRGRDWSRMRALLTP
jgi:hypothetical protein